MIQHDKRSVPDPDEQPDAYTDAEILENLYVERGWSRSDISEFFDITDHEVVKQLDEHGIERDVEYSKQPTNGLARQLFQKGKAEAIK
jgi:hypothetical protein